METIINSNTDRLLSKMDQVMDRLGEQQQFLSTGIPTLRQVHYPYAPVDGMQSMLQLLLMVSPLINIGNQRVRKSTTGEQGLVQELLNQAGVWDKIEALNNRSADRMLARMDQVLERLGDKEQHLRTLKNDLNCIGAIEELKKYYAPFSESHRRLLLRRAVMSANLTQISALLAVGTPHTEDNSENKTMLHVAAHEMRPTSTLLLLDAGAVVDATVTSSRQTPLHFASYKTDTEVVNLLLDRGADINAGDFENDTPLHLAAKYSSLEMVRELVRRGGDPRLKNVFGYTPLDLARSRNSEDVSVWLAELTNSLENSTTPVVQGN